VLDGWRRQRQLSETALQINFSFFPTLAWVAVAFVTCNRLTYFAHPKNRRRLTMVAAYCPSGIAEPNWRNAHIKTA
jgi:hypothetical protein